MSLSYANDDGDDEDLLSTLRISVRIAGPHAGQRTVLHERDYCRRDLWWFRRLSYKLSGFVEAWQVATRSF